MIQRIQSLFLLLAIIALTLTYFFPYVTIGNLELHNYRFIAPEGMESPSFISWQSVPVGISILLHFVILFSYKNRKKQIRMIRYNEILIVATYVLLALSIVKVYGEHGTQFHFGMATWMLVFTLLLNQFARRSIRSDEALVKSVDRIR
jgi:hypothetical protein